MSLLVFWQFMFPLGYASCLWVYGALGTGVTSKVLDTSIAFGVLGTWYSESQCAFQLNRNLLMEFWVRIWSPREGLLLGTELVVLV